MKLNTQYRGWQHETGLSFVENCLKAIDSYRRKFNEAPTIILVQPALVAAAEPVTVVDGVTVQADNDIEGRYYFAGKI